VSAAWLETLLTGPIDAPACPSVAQWWPRHRALAAAQRHRSIDIAILGGAAADRVAWAFGSAFQAALRTLVAGLEDDRLAALCITEKQGNAPRDLRTTLRREGGDVVIDGAKHWATLGPDGALFLVAARDVEASTDARPALRLGRVPAGTPGLHIDTMPPTAFVPEIPHARLRFENLRLPASAVIPGDAYVLHVKPFRTIEDLHVHAAVLAYLVRESRRLGWPREWTERAIANLLAFDAIAGLDPTASSTHVALAGALADGDRLAHEADLLWQTGSDQEAAARWQRDRALMGIASKPRAMRAQKAWERLGATSPTR
jgi:hypothetical protein